MTEEEIRKLGKEALKHCEQYLGTDKWDVAMLAIAKGYELAEKDLLKLVKKTIKKKTNEKIN